MEEKKITVIIPVHTIEGDYKLMLDNAISSVEEFQNDVLVSIVCPSTISDKFNQLSDKLTINVIPNDGETDFCSQVNLGIDKCTTPWFTILEVDDEFKPIWLKSMTEYMNTYTDVSVFLPIVKDVNVEGKFLTFMNESAWAYGFTDRQGFLDNETLLEFQNYQTSGALFKTQTMIDNGKFKENIKLTFSYELLLRLTNNGVIILTVPKIGYQHVNFREDSLFWSYKNNESTKLSPDEVKFWLETAKKEFFFKNKRDINYVAK